MSTRQQRLAQSAHEEVYRQINTSLEEEFGRVCKSFPALIHNSGLCQAVAFAESKSKRKREDEGRGANKGEGQSKAQDKGDDKAQDKRHEEEGSNEFDKYLKSLSTVLGTDEKKFSEECRKTDVLRYQRLTYEALMAASWLKRYAEALLKDSSSSDNGEAGQKGDGGNNDDSGV